MALYSADIRRLYCFNITQKVSILIYLEYIYIYILKYIQTVHLAYSLASFYLA